MNIEEVRNKFLENGYNLLTKTYKSNKDMLEFERDGYIYYNSYNGFTRAYNPKKWSISNPYSIQNLNLFFKENGNTCRVLSKEYSNNKLEFICECGNHYEASVGNVLSGRNIKCKKCSFVERGNKFIKPEKEKVFEKYGCSLIEPYTNGNDYLYFIDKDGYYANASSDSLELYKGKYLIFTIKNKYLIQNIHHYIKTNNLKCKLMSKEINSCKGEKLEFECLCGEKFYMSLNTLLATNKDVCNKCSIKNALKKKFSKDMDEFYSIIEENKLTPIEEYSGRTNRIYFINELGYYVYLSLDSIKNNKTLNHTIFNMLNEYVIQNIENYIKINNLNCTLLSKEYKGKQSKLKFRCDCGNTYYCRMYDFRDRAVDHCKECGKINVKSKMEVLVKQWLEKNNIENIGEKTFIDCKDKYCLPFDFYLPKYNICIECQGKQHYEPVEFFGGMERYDYTVRHDKIKREYCKNKNIRYLELSYLYLKDDKYIKILKTNINKLH